MTRLHESPYYFSVRHDMIGLVPPGAKRILEVGCGGGATGKELKKRGIEEIVGIEIIEDVARSARPHYDALHIGDVEAMTLPYEAGHFDCVLYGDVLEHLRDPWKVLREHNRLVREEGTIIVSIPNVRHYRVIKRLAFRGQWEYRDDGIMDRTHLRFFTLGTALAMIRNAGFEVTTTLKKPSGAPWLKGLNNLTRNSLIDFLVRQYIIAARKTRETA